MFQPIKKTTITEQVIERIAEYITTGKLSPGEKLPTERVLAEQFSVARGRIREALRALSIVGMLTIKPGEGSFVTEKNEAVPAETILYLFHAEKDRIEEVYAARKLIEGEVFRSAVPYLCEKDFGMLAEKVESLRSISYEDPEEFQRQVDEFDLFFGERCGNQVYFRLMQTMIVLRQETSLKLLEIPGAWENCLRCREAMYHAYLSGDSNRIEAVIDDIYESAKEYY